MPKIEYFKNVYESLKKNASGRPRKARSDFATLKILEYWVRIMDRHPRNHISGQRDETSAARNGVNKSSEECQRKNE